MLPESWRRGVRLSTKSRQYLVIFGGFLIMLPLDIHLLWGNVSVYVFSYVWQRQGATSDLGTPYFLACLEIAWVAGIMISGALESRACCRADRRIRLPGFVGIVLFNIGMFLFYIVLKMDVATPIFVVIGASMGMGYGILDIVTSKRIATISDSHNYGRRFAFASSGISFGGCVINPLIAWFVNPENLSPDVKVGTVTVFSQSGIGDKVMFAFLVFGASCVVCHLIGFALLFLLETHEDTVEEGVLPTTSYGATTENSLSSTSIDGDYPSSKRANNTGVTQMIVFPDRADSSSAVKDHHGINPQWPDIAILELNQAVDDLQAEEKTRPTTTTTNTTTTTATIASTDATMDTATFTAKEEKESEKYSSSFLYQILTSPAFWVLWFGYLSTEWVFLVISNYYKEYGLHFIKDDKALANFGTIFGISGMVFRIAWGSVLDTCGFKISMMIINSFLAFLSCAPFFTARLDKWSYLFTLDLLACFRAMSFHTCVFGCACYFGVSNMDIAMGLTVTGNLLLGSVALSLFSFLLQTFGWFSLFFVGSAFNLASLLILIVWKPVKGTYVEM